VAVTPTTRTCVEDVLAAASALNPDGRDAAPSVTSTTLPCAWPRRPVVRIHGHLSAIRTFPRRPPGASLRRRAAPAGSPVAGAPLPRPLQHQSIIHSFIPSISRSLSQSANQSIDQPTNQPTNPTKHSLSQSINHFISCLMVHR